MSKCLVMYGRWVRWVLWEFYDGKRDVWPASHHCIYSFSYCLPVIEMLLLKCCCFFWGWLFGGFYLCLVFTVTLHGYMVMLFYRLLPLMVVEDFISKYDSHNILMMSCVWFMSTPLNFKIIPKWWSGTYRCFSIFPIAYLFAYACCIYTRYCKVVNLLQK